MLFRVYKYMYLRFNIITMITNIAQVITATRIADNVTPMIQVLCELNVAVGEQK